MLLHPKLSNWATKFSGEKARFGSVGD